MATDLDKRPPLQVVNQEENEKIGEEVVNNILQLDTSEELDVNHSSNNEQVEVEVEKHDDPSSPPVVVDAPSAAVSDCNGIDDLQDTKDHVDTDADADADADASSYVIVDAADPLSDHPCTTTDDSEPLQLEKKQEEELQLPVPINPDSSIEDKTDEVVQVVEIQENNATSSEDQSHLQVDATTEEEQGQIETNATSSEDQSHLQVGATAKEEQDQIETNATIEEKDSLGSDVELVEDIKEPTIEAANIVQAQLQEPDSEEKGQEETTLPQVEPDSHQLNRGVDKADDQAIVGCESESKQNQESDPDSEVTDSVEAPPHQPCHGEDTSQLPASEEAKVCQNSVDPVVESPESEPHLNNDENIEEESKLESSTEVCHATQIAATHPSETETDRTDDGKDCEIETLANDIPVDEPSTHLETENLNSGLVNCPSDDLQVEIAAANDTTDEIGETLIVSPVEQTVSKTEVIDDSAADQESNSLSPGSNIETEPQNVDGHVESLELPESNSVEVEKEADVGNVSAENGEGVLAGPVSCVDREQEVVEVSVERDESMSTISVDDVNSEAQAGNGSSEVNQSILDVPAHDLEGQTDVTNGITESTNLPADHVDDSQSESWGGNNSSLSKEELSSTSTVESESLVSKGSAANGERNSDGFNDVNSIENEGEQSSHEDNNGKSSCEGDGIEGFVSNGSTMPAPEDSSVGPLEGTKVECEVENRTFRYLVRIPRYGDDKLRNQIELAQRQVEERTQNRDDIRSKIQSMRACSSESRDKFEAARLEERAARDALNAKRREMDSVQLVLSRMKSATSIEDIHDRVRGMEHRIEHETVPLKEEKQLIREIKQLKIQREQLSSSLQGELQPTPQEKAKIEDRFKALKQEMDSCRKEVIRLEGITQAARKMNNDEYEKQRVLQKQFRAADDLRQEAYIHLQNLKKQMYEKNKYFRMYKEDGRKAEDFASARDREAVHHLCYNQVESMIDLWNKNEEFRKDYIRCNTFSTLRRLRTLDGRSLGPDEESPSLYALEGRVGKSLPPTANNDFPSLPTSEQGKSFGKDVETVVKSEPKNLKTDSKSVVKLEQKHPAAKSKTLTKTIDLEISAVTVSDREEKQENEESKKTKEEEELARKAEEIRRKEEAAKLKEQRRLEEKAKAKEAEERKRRNAEKAQARAELRAQKEAELKEKEREKKARKKERKKEKVETVNGGNEEEAVSRSESTQPEIIQEPEIKEKPKTVVKRPQKPSTLAKPKVVPPPLRNRGKKRMQQWMWILLVVAVIVALFLVGNIGFSFKFGLPSFGL